MNVNKTFLVYKLISPSGKFYIGMTSKSLDERLQVHFKDRQRLINHKRPLPRFYSALSKYPLDTWTREILYNNLLFNDAAVFEKEKIKELQTTNPDYGYNMAEGGNGGNTGRNGENWKRSQHSIFLKQWFKDHPEQSSMAAKKAWKTIHNNPKRYKEIKQIRSESTPRGKNHWNHTGMWVVNFVEYETLAQAVQATKINESTIINHCNNPDKICKCKNKYLQKGQTPRQLGFYRIIKESI